MQMSFLMITQQKEQENKETQQGKMEISLRKW